MGSKQDHTDVLIVGAGTSAGIAAKHLAEAGFTVVCLEQGTWVDPGNLPGNKPEYEILGAGNWHPDPNVRGRREDYPLDHSEADLPVWMYNGVGGSSVLYGGIWARALPSDFRVRSLDGVADDWPISYDELLPYYQAVEREMSVAGEAHNPAYPPGFEPPLPAAPIHRTGQIMAEGMNKLGWHWWPGTNSIPTVNRASGEGQCVRYGVCRMGCPEAAKSSTDVTHLRDAVALGAQVVTRARVARVTLDEHGRANGAVYFRDGVEHFQSASLVIMAAGGIGTPRLLLMSTSERFPDGLANSSGLVGKRLMLHPYGAAVGVYSDDLENWLGPAGEHIGSMQFYETDPSRGFVRGAKWSLLPIAGPLEAAEKWTHPLSLAGEEMWGDGSAGRMQDFVRMLQWHVIPEDLPEETNAVSLHPTLTDSDGLPAAKVRYRVAENTRKIVDFNLARALEAHQAAGATKSWVAGRNFMTGHNTGTAKMGNDPATSVVDRFGRTHDVPNLYIIDASVFTTSTGVNPTATICALAKRTATYIASNARSQEVAS
ncbi:GMC family oxidoreductase [Planosporangium flavigriseum]|uniref:Choline dehydrogenase n=1 Tax=Planosporangium flavigriseum TaxID=373681 RepID=A0A8J3M035_9ACTN|nr:GMC family oxidoreductase [Planosporangium flavigriseum]GIG76641.1 choline dehydrogenase [Planosporangium flavigriseum]